MSTSTYRPRFGFDIRINPDQPPQPSVKRRCAKPGCAAGADVYVPKSRHDMNDRQWLCREHLREHNRSWNYFAGMSDSEIERFCLDAVTGHRPTWPLGKRAASDRVNEKEHRTRSYWSYRVEDGFAVFEESAEAAPPPRATRLTKGQLDALAVLNLEDNASLHDIKARYKELVKRFHPDANGGSRGTEERLRQVIRAYGHLRATGLV
jgi:hypothetical protein